MQEEQPLSQDDIKDVNERLFYDMPKAQTELGVLFGAGGMSRAIAEEAVKLKAAGAFNKIAIAGGGMVFNPLLLMGFARKGDWGLFGMHIWDTITSGNNEGKLMRGIMRKAGVDSRDFTFLDPKSKNTGENIAKTKRTIARFGSATFITSAPMQRRALGTARAHHELDHVDITTHPVESFGASAANWHEQEDTYLGRFIRRYVTGEYAKMDPNNPENYMALGYCKDPDIEAERARVSKLPTYSL